MNLTVSIKRFLKRKLATAVLVSASVAAFATLGDGGKKGSTTLNSGKTTNAKSFSLKTNFNYRGNHLFSSNQPRYITLNTTVTYHKGNATYIVPLKKKVFLDKVKFNPAPNKL
jgi:hypothetical protein